MHVLWRSGSSDRLDRTPLDSTDKLAIAVFIILNAAIMAALWLNMSYFYLDSPLYHEMAENNSLFYQWFTIQDRFIPINRMRAILTKQIFGTDPAWTYLTQYVYLIIGMVSLYCLSRRLELPAKHAVVTVAPLLVCSSAFENIFTISKAEITILVGILLFLPALWKVMTAPCRKGVDWVLLGASIFLCMLSKETWFVIVIPIGAMLLYSCVFDRKLVGQMLAALMLFTANLVILKVYEHFYVVPSAYMADFSVTWASMYNNFIFYTTYHWDIVLMGGISFFLGWKMLLINKTDRRAAFFLAANLGGWGYLAGLCIWRMACSYYVYPAVGFFAVSFIAVFLCPVGKWCRHVVFLAAGVTMCFTVSINYLVAVSHIDLGEAFTRACESVAKHTGSGDRVILENNYYYEEQTGHVQRLMNRYGCNTEVIGGYQSIYGIYPGDTTLAVWGTNLDAYNEAYTTGMPRIGDYILFRVNQRNFFGPVRSVNPANSGTHSLLDNKASGYTLEVVDQYVFKRNALLPSTSGWKTPMYAGYILYRVTETSYRVNGITLDGWSGEEVSIEDYALSDDLIVEAGASLAYMAEGAERNKIRILVDGVPAAELTVAGAGGEQIRLNDWLREAITDEERHTITLKINSAASPADYGQEDGRVLGMQIQIYPHEELFTVSGLYGNGGWSGPEIIFQDYCPAYEANIKVGRSFLNLVEGIEENTVVIYQDGEEKASISISALGGETLQLNSFLEDKGQPMEVTLQILRHGIPAEYGFNEDTNDYGIQMFVETEKEFNLA